jgi:hypothetical protein
VQLRGPTHVPGLHPTPQAGDCQVGRDPATDHELTEELEEGNDAGAGAVREKTFWGKRVNMPEVSETTNAKNEEKATE